MHAAYLASALLLFRTRAGARAKAARGAMEEEEEEEGEVEEEEEGVGGGEQQRRRRSSSTSSAAAAAAAATAATAASATPSEELAWLPTLNVAAMALQLLFQAPFEEALSLFSLSSSFSSSPSASSFDGESGSDNNSLHFSSSSPSPPQPLPTTRCDFPHLMGLFKFPTRGLSWSAGAGADVALFALLALHQRMASTAAARDAARIAAGDRAAAARAAARSRAEAARAQALGALADARATAARAARVASLKKGVTRSGAGFGIDLALLEDAPPIVDDDEREKRDRGNEKGFLLYGSRRCPPFGCVGVVGRAGAPRRGRKRRREAARPLEAAPAAAPEVAAAAPFFSSFLSLSLPQTPPPPASKALSSKLRSGPVACAALALLWVSDVSAAGALAVFALLGYALIAQTPSRAFWFSTLAASELLLVAQYFWLATVRLGCGSGRGKAEAEAERQRQRRQRRLSRVRLLRG